MKSNSLLLLVTLLLLVDCTANRNDQKPALAEIRPIADSYFGTTITDPFRYMENLQDSTVIRWIMAQTDYSRNILNHIPGRQKLIDKMIDFDNRKSAMIPMLEITENERYFYLKTTPADETCKLYYRDGIVGEEKLLFDPKSFEADTTQKFVIHSISPSFDGSKIAIHMSPNGSEISVILTLDVRSKKLFPERIDHCWWEYPICWLPDDKSFFYCRLRYSDSNQKNIFEDTRTYLHKVGTDPAKDREVFSRAKYPDLHINPEAGLYLSYDRDSKLLLSYVSTVESNQTVYYAPLSDLSKERIDWKQLFTREDQVFNFYTTDKEVYFLTSKNAPNGKLLRISLLNPDLNKADVVVPEDKNMNLTSLLLSKYGVYYSYSENGVKARLFFLPKGAKSGEEIKLPFAAGTMFFKSKGIQYDDIWINIAGWTSDYRSYRYKHQTNNFTRESLSSTAEYPEYKDLVVEELMIPSYDGLKVPLSLVYRKDIRKNAKNPILMFGYGAYGVSVNPFFNAEFLLWTQDGGILAFPHVRGGGELGEAWYRAGYKSTKPNSWKDLISCTEYLIREKYTSAENVAIYGQSAGGILIGRAMTERPDLFGAVISEVGIMNSVRYELTPNGPDNVAEFGTMKDSVECKALIEMDAYLHVKDGLNYPAFLVTAGMKDSRVIAWQPAKFAARLQAENKSAKPMLFWADSEAGHGIGNTKTKDFEKLADVLSFAFWNTGQHNYQLK